MLFILINKKSQVWYIDFIIGLLIFIFAIVTFYDISSNLYSDERLRLDNLLLDGRVISSSLLSAGVPANWDNESVISIGLTDNNYRLNATKVMAFANLSYSKAKYRFGASNDYYIFFQNKSSHVLNISQCGFGSPEVIIETEGDQCKLSNVSSANPKELVKVERFLIYNSSIIKMVVYVWV